MSHDTQNPKTDETTSTQTNTDTGADEQVHDTDSGGTGHPAESSREEYVEEANEYERAPEGFEAEWDVEDTQVPGHDVVVEVEGRGDASARLVSWAIVEDLQDEGGEFGAADVAKILREHYKSPSFEGLDADGVRNMKMAEPDRHLDAIMPGMSTEMNADGSAQVDSGNQ